MADRYEYYITGDTDASYAYGSSWRAQTFTPETAHKITSVKLKLYRLGSPGTLTVGIRATDGSGHPTGSDLCSGTTDGDALTEDEGGAWYEITLGDGYNLDADTKYAIVIRATAGDSSNRVYWRMDYAGTYAGGNYEYSINSGSTWGSETWDFMFEDWGEPAGVTHELAGVIGGVASVSGIALITRGLAAVTAGVASVSGLAVVTYRLAGITQGVCSVSGTWTKYLKGLTEGVCSVSGTWTKYLKGLTSGAATVTGNIFHVRVAIRVLTALRNIPPVRTLPPVR